jgi:hypothetical protein
LFVDGTAFAGIERRRHVETPSESVTSGNADGVVGGGGVAIGAWLSPHITARMELMFPSSVKHSDQTSDVIALGLGEPIRLTERIESSERLRSASALVAYHTGRRHRMQIAYVGGAAFLFAKQRTVVLQDIPQLPPIFLTPLAAPEIRTQRIELTTTDYAVTAEAGLDADISIAGRWSVVPQVRIVGFDGGLSIRPGVALRGRW